MTEEPTFTDRGGHTYPLSYLERELAGIAEPPEAGGILRSKDTGQIIELDEDVATFLATRGGAT